jgi:hypothetical protein
LKIWGVTHFRRRIFSPSQEDEGGKAVLVLGMLRFWLKNEGGLFLRGDYRGTTGRQHRSNTDTTRQELAYGLGFLSRAGPTGQPASANEGKLETFIAGRQATGEDRAGSAAEPASLIWFCRRLRLFAVQRSDCASDQKKIKRQRLMNERPSN